MPTSRGRLKSISTALQRLARTGDVEGFRAYIRSDTFLKAFAGLDPDRRQSVMRAHAKAEALCEAKARHPLVRPKGIDAKRAEKVADVAVLVVDDPKGCGLATRVGADADEAFAVVHHACAAASYTVAHEVGHLIGARHELSFVNGTKWRDIMAYKDSCGGCPRMPAWSSPTVLVNGEPAGTVEFDNARVIAEQASRVAAFR